MSWYLIALVSPLLWSFCNHIDKLMLDKYYRGVKAGALMFMTSLMSLVVVLGVLIIKPSLAHIPLHSALIGLAGGVVYFLAIFPYLYALSKDEASRVIPLFQVQPIIAFVLALVFLHEHLVAHQLVAGLIILMGSMLIVIDLDDNLRFKKSVFWLMMLSTTFFALEALLFKYIGRNVGFWSTAFYLDGGVFLSGLALFIFGKEFRNGFTRVIKQNAKPVIFASFVNEGFNVIARLIFNYATLLAPIALVTLVSGTQPIFVLAIGVLLTIFLPSLSKESLLRRHMVQKISAVSITFIGTVLLVK